MKTQVPSVFSPTLDIPAVSRMDHEVRVKLWCRWSVSAQASVSHADLGVSFSQQPADPTVASGAQRGPVAPNKEQRKEHWLSMKALGCLPGPAVSRMGGLQPNASPCWSLSILSCKCSGNTSAFLELGF